MTGHSNWLLKCVTMVYSYKEDKKKYIDIISLYTRRRRSIDLEIVDKHILDIIEWMKCFFLFFLFFSLIDFLRVVFFSFLSKGMSSEEISFNKETFFFFAYLLRVWLFVIRRKRRRNKVEINKNYPSCAAAAPYNRRNKKTKKDHLHDSRTGVSHTHRESEEKNNTKRKDVFQIDRW